MVAKLIPIKFWAVFLLFIFGLLSCKNSKKFTTLPEIVIKDSNIQKNSSLDILIEDIELIKLASTEKAFLREVSKLIVLNDTLVISDKKSSKVLVFKGNGEFIQEIGHIGRGPGEFLEVSDLFYSDGILFILDIGNRKIHKYKPTGEFIASLNMNIKFAGYNFEKNHGNYLAFRSNQMFPDVEAFNLITFNKDLTEVIDSKSPIPEKIKGMSFGGSNVLESFNNESYALPPYDSLIYKVDTSGHINPAYKLSIDSKYLAQNSKIWNSSSKDEFQIYEQLMKSEAVWFVYNLTINTNYVAFSYFRKEAPYFCLFSKEEKTTKIFKNPTVTSNKLFVDIIGKSKNRFYAVIRENQIEGINKSFNQMLGLKDNLSLVKFSFK